MVFENGGGIVKKLISTVLSISLVFPAIGTNAYTLSKPIPKEDVIVMFKKSADTKLVQNTGGVIEEKYKNIPAVSASVPVSSISALKKNPKVEYVEIDKPVKLNSQTVDWGHVNTKTDIANTNGFTGKGVKIGILDTGIKTTHQDLYISGGYNPTGGSYEDIQGHGTHVAGIIGAKDNDFGVIGVAPDSQIYAVKVMNNADGTGSISDIIKGIDWSISNHMDIINMSLGSNDFSQAFQDSVNRAHDAGIFVVAAAGNDGNSTGIGDTVDYPGRFDNVIAIAATDSQNKKASFSSAGPAVDFSAPGYNIYSTSVNGTYVNMSGTSMATPYFSGILALYKEAYPTYTNDQIITLMEQNAVDLGDLGRDNLFGYGLAQAPVVGDSNLPNMPVPSIPMNFRANDILATSVGLTWDTDSSAKIYDLKRNGVLIYSGTSNSFLDKKVLANTTYQYELTARNVSGKSPASTISIKTKATGLTMPSVRIAKVTNGYNVTWSKVTNATNYRLYRNDTLIYSGSALSYFEDRTRLTPGSSYIYSLFAENTTTISSTSRLTFTVEPDVVTRLTESHTSNTVEANWNASLGATSYIVKLNGSQVYSGTATQITYNKLLSNTTYTVSVAAVNKGGTSTPSTVSFKTPQTIPTVPTTLTITGTKDSATLRWSGIYNASSYNIYRNGNLVKTVNAPTNLYQDLGLSAGTTYNYAVSAVNELGESMKKEVNFTTIPNSPTTLNAVGGQNSITLSWNAVPGATYYIVKRGTTIIYKGNNTSYINTKLINDTNYSYSVQAGNNSGTNASFVATTAKTLPAINTMFTSNIQSSYTTGQAIPITLALKDETGKPVVNDTIYFKMYNPNGTYKSSTFRTDASGYVNLLLYTNIYSMKGVYKIEVRKNYVSTLPYNATSNIFTFNLQ